MASAAPVNKAFKLCVEFQPRPGGGLRAFCKDVPGFVLSNVDCDRVLANVEPVLEVILSEMFHNRVKVLPLCNMRDHLEDAGVIAKAGVGKREYVTSSIGA